MCTIDLKALLLLGSMTKQSLCGQKSYRNGKVRYTVCYELRGTQLILKQVKRVRSTRSLQSRLRRRIRRQLKNHRPCTLISQGCQALLDSPNEEAQPANKRAVPEVLHATSQTKLLQQIHVQLDTQDLVKMHSKDQQTLVKKFQNNFSQTGLRAFRSRFTQMQPEMKTRPMQTEWAQACLGTQTELLCNCISTQTEDNSCQSGTQTSSDEVELKKSPIENLLYLILATLQGHSELYQSGMKSISQLIDLSLSSHRVKSEEVSSEDENAQKCQDKELLSQIKMEQTKQMLEQQLIGDHAKLQELVVSHLQQLEAKLLSRKKKRHHKRPNYSKTWNCTLKCKGCGLHMHRIRYRVPTDSKCTQTEIELEAENNSTDAATQTQKQRSFWTMRRS